MSGRDRNLVHNHNTTTIGKAWLFVYGRQHKPGSRLDSHGGDVRKRHMSSVEAAALCQCAGGGAAAVERCCVAAGSPLPTAGLRFSVIGASTSGVLPATTAGKASCTGDRAAT